MSLFSAMIVTGLAFGAPRKIKYLFVPNVELPTEIKNLISVGKQTIGPIAWPSSKTRDAYKCREVACANTKRIFNIELPRLLEPNAPVGSPWSTLMNAWHLNSALFATGYISDYPWATILEVPKDTPSNVKFLLDIGPNGIRPSINANNSLFDGPNGLNVTGDYAHSFVIINNALHDVYFNTVGHNERPEGPIQYWTIRPNQRVLMWPANTYWHSINTGGPRHWNASLLASDLSIDFMAYLTESLMYNYLAPQSPTVQT